ncbi:MAG: immunoglobulin domain-containing protein [Verrucomicrobia bacterium]|nr:immunoglobulin domain-containing protein [Verrucomicrobiota bacterium]
MSGTSHGGGSGNDYATIKYSSAGAPLWTNRFNGAASSNDVAMAIAVDASRSVFVTGSTIGTGSNDFATIKYSSAGAALWTNYYNGTGNSNDVAVAVEVDAGGNVLVAGYSRGSGTGNDYAVIKYSNTGTPLWTNRYNGPANGPDQPAALATDTNGSVFVTGYSAGSGNDYATVKYSSAGAPLWTNRYNGPGNNTDEAVAVAVDGSGNVLVAGYSRGGTSGNDYAAIKYSNTGAPLWTNRYNGPGNSADNAFALAVDRGGYVILTGGSAGSGSGDDFATIKYQGALQPFITVQPPGQVLYPGTNVTFRVTATGLAPLAYQWRKNGIGIGNATNSSYGIAGLATNDAGNFDVVLTNYYGSVTSAVAVLTVTLAPVITVQAPDQVVFPGANVTFTMTAAGEPPLAYQWRKDGVTLLNATNTSYSLTGVTTNDSGDFTLVVTNAHGAVTSAVATLTVVLPPAISVQPSSQTAVSESGVSFTVTASGGALSYQWRRDGSVLLDVGNITGANTATLTLTDVSSGDAGIYSVFISNPAGSVTSSNATLTLVVPPEITIPPASQNVAAGRNVTFTVAATGSAPLQYQWRLNTVNIANATNATLTLTSVGAANAGSYTVVVTNLAGSATSPAATLIVRVPPVITLQPQSQTAIVGANVTFTVAATGTPPLTYQWQNNGIKILNATGTSLTLVEVQGTNAGGYNVIVSGPDAAVASATASLTVDLPPLPFADNFTNRVTTNSYSGSGSGGNTNASRETGEPRHANKTGGKSVWLNWQAPANGAATFSTRGSSFDTMLAVYTGTNLTALTEVASDDDAGGLYTSQVKFNALAGTNYAIAVDGLANAAGRIVLNWTLDDTVVEVPRILVHPVNQTVGVGADVTFTVSGAGTPPLSYQWYFRGTAIAGATNTSLTILNVQVSDVGAYLARVNNAFGQTAQSLPCILEIGGNAEAQSRDKFEDLFEIVNIGSGASAKSIRRRLAGFPSVSVGTLGTQIFNNLDSADQLNQPISGSVSGGSTRWFVIKAAGSGVMVVDTIGSDINTVMAVYTGTNLLELVFVAEDDNGAPDGIRSRVRFPAVNGTDYVVAVDGVNGAKGNIALNWGLGTVPAFTLHPTDRKATVSETVVFSAQAASLPVPFYQWRKDGVALPGQTGATLVFDHVLAEDAGWYDVVVSNFTGLAVSEPANLTVGTATRMVNNTRTPGGFSVTLQTEPGKTYELQATDSLESDSWTAIRTIIGDGAFQVFTDPQASGAKRFYRLVIY